MDKLRILIADDHAVFRAGLRLLLETQGDMQVVGEAEDGQAAVSKTEAVSPDVVLMDLAMPGLTGMEAISRIKRTRPEVAILCLTMYEDDRYFFRAIRGGADGYIVKGAPADELITAIRTISRGQTYLYPSVAKRLMRAYLDRSEALAQTAEPLTSREREVLQLFAEGRTGKEISEHLSLSPHTVERHRANIMAKLGLHSRAELVKYAIRHGLIEIDR